MTAETQDEPNTGDEPATTSNSRRRMVTLAAGGVLLALVAAALIGFLGRDTGPVIASAGIVQGDVRIQSAGGGNWRQLGSIAAPLVAGTSLRATSSGRIALDLPAQGSLRLDASTQVTLSGERTIELRLLGGGALVVESRDHQLAPAFHRLVSAHAVGNPCSFKCQDNLSAVQIDPAKFFKFLDFFHG